jgi:hypothetical protein
MEVGQGKAINTNFHYQIDWTCWSRREGVAVVIEAEGAASAV